MNGYDRENLPDAPGCGRLVFVLLVCGMGAIIIAWARSHGAG